MRVSQVICFTLFAIMGINLTISMQQSEYGWIPYWVLVIAFVFLFHRALKVDDIWNHLKLNYSTYDQKENAVREQAGLFFKFLTRSIEERLIKKGMSQEEIYRVLIEEIDSEEKRNHIEYKKNFKLVSIKRFWWSTSENTKEWFMNSLGNMDGDVKEFAYMTRVCREYVELRFNPEENDLENHKLCIYGYGEGFPAPTLKFVFKGNKLKAIKTALSPAELF